MSFFQEPNELKNFRALIIEEVKPVARKIYKEHRNYTKALSMYRLISNIIPDDLEVLAYIGRCYARLGQWDESDKAFETAIKIASKTNKPIWWLYRDWGHIRARYKFYPIAMGHFEKALKIKPDDSSISASVAYMLWQAGDDERNSRAGAF